MAGSVVMAAAARRGVAVLPVDSEHNAIHQCLHGRCRPTCARLILTASGGPFRGLSADELATVTAADALQHPTWRMGPKITIDSATLMNKGLEVIEARWLFDVGRGSHRRAGPSAIDRPLDGRARRRIRDRAAWRDRHAPADPVCVFVSGAVGRAAAAARSGASRAAGFRGPGHGAAFPCLALAFRALPWRRRAVDRPERRQRSRRVCISRRRGWVSPGFPASSSRRWTPTNRSAARHVTGLADVRAVDAWARGFAEHAGRWVYRSRLRIRCTGDHSSGLSLRSRRADFRARARPFPDGAAHRRPRAHVLARIRPQAVRASSAATPSTASARFRSAAT